MLNLHEKHLYNVYFDFITDKLMIVSRFVNIIYFKWVISGREVVKLWSNHIDRVDIKVKSHSVSMALPTGSKDTAGQTKCIWLYLIVVFILIGLAISGQLFFWWR